MHQIQLSMHPDAIQLPSKDYQLLSRETFLSMFYNAANDWLYARWEGERNPETMKKGAAEILRLIKETKTRKLINDSTHSVKAMPEAEQWVIEVMGPSLVQVGLEYLA